MTAKLLKFIVLVYIFHFCYNLKLVAAGNELSLEDQFHNDAERNIHPKLWIKPTVQLVKKWKSGEITWSGPWNYEGRGRNGFNCWDCNVYFGTHRAPWLDDDDARRGPRFKCLTSEIQKTSRGRCGNDPLKGPVCCGDEVCVRGKCHGTTRCITEGSCSKNSDCCTSSGYSCSSGRCYKPKTCQNFKDVCHYHGGGQGQCCNGLQCVQSTGRCGTVSTLRCKRNGEKCRVECDCCNKFSTCAGATTGTGTCTVSVIPNPCNGQPNAG